MQQASREKIILAAFTLFADKGFARTSVQDIAQEASISKGLIYHYYQSKEDILHDIFVHLKAEWDTSMDWEKQLPPRQLLRRFLELSVLFIIKQPKMNRLVLSLAVQPEVIAGLGKDVLEMRDSWMEKLSALLKALHYAEPEIEACLLVSMLDGMSIGYLTLGKEYPILQMEKMLLKRYGVSGSDPHD